MAAGHSGQFTPMRLPVNTVIHTTLVGLEPATFRSLVRRATSSATEPTVFSTSKSTSDNAVIDRVGKSSTYVIRYCQLPDFWTCALLIPQHRVILMSNNGDEDYDDAKNENKLTNKFYRVQSLSNRSLITNHSYTLRLTCSNGKLFSSAAIFVVLARCNITLKPSHPLQSLA